MYQNQLPEKNPNDPPLWAKVTMAIVGIIILVGLMNQFVRWAF